VKICHLGDIYEFQFPGRHRTSTAAEIEGSSNDYSLIINQLKNMDTVRLYGNHDFSNLHSERFRFEYTLGKVYIEHGFAGDNLMANPHNPNWKLVMAGFQSVNKLKQIFGEIGRTLNLLPPDKVFAVGLTSGENPRGGIASKSKYESEYKSIKEYYCRRLEKGSNGSDIKISIIGHTHSPHLDSNVKNGEFVFVDAGAWTEGRSDFVVVTQEELAICRYKRETEMNL
jgi:UDP-2,3-diacylglucosamine pyrophosphatase LpxH